MYFDPFCVFLCFILIVLMIDVGEKRIYEGSFWTSEFSSFEKCHKFV